MKTAHTPRAWAAALLTIALIFISCDEETGSLGIFPQEDAISTSTASFGILSSDLLNDVVPAGSAACYLGRVIDPETDQAITASFAAQFHTFEDYAFPSRDDIVTDGEGHLCDSIELRLFIRSTFGDKNNPMKLEVWPLSADDDKLIKETDRFFTNTDLWQFVDESQGPVATKVITATDFIMSDAQRASSNYSDNIRIVLPRQFGEHIMQTFYDNPAAFHDSYSFIRKVCPGYFFRTTGGTGTMLNIEVSNINLYYRYKSQAFPDSILDATCRFAATPEVIQSTQFESSNLASLIGNEAYTMLKTPAGVCTELVLPIDEIYDGHESDSITRASFNLMRLNNQDADALDADYALGIPQEVLLVRKQNKESFFSNHQVSDSQQSFTTSFIPTYNSYTFGNIGRLISYLHDEKAASMAAESDTFREECKLSFIADQHGWDIVSSEADRQLAADERENNWSLYEAGFGQKWEEEYLSQWSQAWNDRHPDWNHVVIVPVTTSSATDSYGYSSQVSVNQDLSLCSTKLVRGTEASPIQMQVIYSRFAGK